MKVVAVFFSLLIVTLFNTAYASDLPTVRIGTAELVDPTQADTVLGTGTTHTACVAACGRPEIVALARALRHDPALIYEYVRNRVEIEPTFGLTKGALGAHLDEYGTSFDQAHLLVELLRESGYTANYKYGVISLSQAQFDDWFGITDAEAACYLLARGGFPATVNGSSGANTDCSTITGSVSTITMSHIWVEVTVGGTVYEIDPSYKAHTFHSGINLGTAMGYSASGISTAASMGTGTDNGVSYVNGINSGSVESTLGGYATSLLSHIENNMPVDVQLEDVIGGQDIDQAVLPNGLADASVPYTVSSSTTWSGDIPDQYRTSLLVEFYAGAGDTPGSALMYADNFYGRTVLIEPFNTETRWGTTGSTPFNAKLKVDGSTLATFSKNQTVGNQQGYFFELTIDHPYAAESGGYMDEFIEKRADIISHVILVNGFGHVSPNIMSRWGEELPKDTDLPEATQGCPNDGCQESTIEGSSQENTNLKMGANWLAQMSRMAEMQARIGGATFQHHHSLGFIFNESTVNATSIDNAEMYVADQTIRMDIDGAYSVTFNDNTATREDEEGGIAHALTAAAGALEGSVYEQMSDAVDTASTAERFEWAENNISANLEFLLFTPADVSKVDGMIGADIGGDCVGFCPQLVDGTTTPPFHDEADYINPVVATIEDYLNAGYSVLVPNDAFLGPGYHMGAKLGSFGPGNPVTERQSSRQRGGAMVAFRETNGHISEVVHVVTGSRGGSGKAFKGGGASLDPNHEEVFNPAEAADLLKDRFEDRSSALGVDLASGVPGYSSGSVISVGSGGFPYELSAELTYKRGDRSVEGGDPSLFGMVHNWEIEASISGSGMEAMGATDVRNAVASIVAFYAAQDVAGQGTTTLDKVVLVPFIKHWWLGHLTFNTVSIDAGGSGGQQFFRLVDGSFNGPAGSPMELEALGAFTRTAVRKDEEFGQIDSDASLTRYWDYAAIKAPTSDDAFKLTFGDGSFQIFSNLTKPETLKLNPKTWFLMTRWELPSGFGVDISYQTVFGGGINLNAHTKDKPFEVTNDFGRKLTFTYEDIRTYRIEDLANDRSVKVDTQSAPSGPPPGFEITNIDGTITKIDVGCVKTSEFVSCPVPAGSRPFEGAMPVEAVYSPNDLTTPSLKYEYDALYRVVEAKDAQALADETASDPNPRPGYQFYVVPGHRGERVDPLGGEFTVYYDEDGNAAEFIDELGRVVTANYDGIGRVTERVFPEGDMSQFTYDDHSNVLSFTHVPKPASGLSNRTASATWDMTWNKPTSVTDFMGNVTSFTIGTIGGEKGQVTQATLPTVPGPTGANITPVWGFAYNANGQVDTVTDPLGAVNDNDYDALGNLLSIAIDKNGLNLKTHFEYDAVGNRTAMIDARGSSGGSTFKTTAEYDEMRRVIRTIAPEGETTLLFYDLAGQQTAVEQYNGGSWVRTEAQYTVTGQEFLITTPDLAYTVNVYDDMDRVLETHDPQGRITRFTYDAAGQLIKEIRAYGTGLQQDYSTFTYSDNGQQLSIADANGNLTEFFYDGFDRLVETRFPSKTVAGMSDPADNELFTFDANGNILTKTTRADDVITNTYDALDRILTKTPGLDPVVNYFYDARGRQTEVKFADNSQSIKYTYDGAGRITVTDTELPDGLSGNKTKLVFQYDEISNRTQIKHQNSGTRVFNYTYDESSRMTTVKKGSTLLAQYSYDTLGRRTKAILSDRSVSSNTIDYTYEPDSALDSLKHELSGTANDVSWYFDYNDANQVTGRTITNAVYSYDPVAKNETYTANGLNQYTAVGAAALTYDANGNLTGDGTWTYTYNVENRLINATNGVTNVTYTYDPLGRRVKKDVNGSATYYLSDGAEEVIEFDDNSTNTILRRYIYGPGLDEPIVMYDGSGTANSNRRFYRADAQGTIIAITNHNGVVQEQYSYSSYGEPDNPAGQPIRYTGRRWDEETGLYYYRARYYNPALGRFLQTDPVGYSDEMNMYAYAGNDPTNAMDPTGLAACDTQTNTCQIGNITFVLQGEATKLIDAFEAVASEFQADFSNLDARTVDVTVGATQMVNGKATAATTEFDQVNDATPVVFNKSTINALSAGEDFVVQGVVGHELVHVGDFAKELDINNKTGTAWDDNGVKEVTLRSEVAGYGWEQTRLEKKQNATGLNTTEQTRLGAVKAAKAANQTALNAQQAKTNQP